MQSVNKWSWDFDLENCRQSVSSLQGDKTSNIFHSKAWDVGIPSYISMEEHEIDFNFGETLSFLCNIFSASLVHQIFWRHQQQKLVLLDVVLGEIQERETPACFHCCALCCFRKESQGLICLVLIKAKWGGRSREVTCVAYDPFSIWFLYFHLRIVFVVSWTPACLIMNWGSIRKRH